MASVRPANKQTKVASLAVVCNTLISVSDIIHIEPTILVPTAATVSFP
jgi:hypothetical protein